MGIEPTLPAWKAGILPLNYTRTTTAITRMIIMKIKMSSIFLKNALLKKKKQPPAPPEKLVKPFYITIGHNFYELLLSIYFYQCCNKKY